MRVTVLGLRGLPHVAGGIETHVEQLCQRLVRLGCEIEVLVRSPYVTRSHKHFAGIRLRRLWSPRLPGVEALMHSLIGVLYAAVTRPDILHVHAIGPAIVTPLARLLGLRVVVTHHGHDYERDKWGRAARAVLRVGEHVGMRYAHARIAISQGVADMIRTQFDRESHVIHNGTVARDPVGDTDVVRHFGLEPGKYFLEVGRLVPEKRQIDLLSAFVDADVPAWKVALVGELGSDAYSRQVIAAAHTTRAVLTGFQTGDALAQLYSHAGAFVLPSSHEGFSIVLLEALNYALPVLASDIPANREVGLESWRYFPVGDRAALTRGLERLAGSRPELDKRAAFRTEVLERFNWDEIAARTLSVYQQLLSRSPGAVARIGASASGQSQR